jgi:hypothetical protein
LTDANPRFCLPLEDKTGDLTHLEKKQTILFEILGILFLVQNPFFPIFYKGGIKTENMVLPPPAGYPEPVRGTLGEKEAE